MTATSAQSASNANPFPDLANVGAELRTVLLPGSPATYANRAVLREMGLRWDPAGHRWHGTTTAAAVKTLREGLGLEVRCFGTLEPPRGPSPPRPSKPVQVIPPPAIRSRGPTHRPRFGDYSRTRFESRVAFGGPDESEDVEETATPTRQFGLLEITSGLPDDSREEDERAAEQRLRDLRGRVKAGGALVFTTPGLAETLARD